MIDVIKGGMLVLEMHTLPHPSGGFHTNDDGDDDVTAKVLEAFTIARHCISI